MQPRAPNPKPRAAAALAAAHAHRVGACPELLPEAAQSREHGGESIELHEDRGGLSVGDQTECRDRFECRRGFIALGACAAKALTSIVAVACGGLGEVEVGAEKGASKLVGE